MLLLVQPTHETWHPERPHGVFSPGSFVPWHGELSPVSEEGPVSPSVFLLAAV